ncbi:MAG: biopolymer transporter ExbD [Candidatus Omnitrophica bacterium]|nr:biopolymer transporter ExbD [Candidatus Omnitrophota bacterium]
MIQLKRNLRLPPNLPIDPVPFITVIFQLIFFFILSSFTFQSGINVKLPKALTSDLIKEDNIIIKITGENITYLNNQVITQKELEQILEESTGKNSSVLINADRRASFGRIMDVWNSCRNKGIERVNIATEQEN